jgi:aminobenzoyl-glutamate utilization protein B
MKRSSLFAAAAAAVLALSLSVAVPVPGMAAELSADSQAKLITDIDTYSSRMADVALAIWNEPELGYQETKTTALLQGELRKAGFTIEAGLPACRPLLWRVPAPPTAR